MIGLWVFMDETLLLVEIYILYETQRESSTSEGWCIGFALGCSLLTMFEYRRMSEGLENQYSAGATAGSTKRT